MDVGNTQIGGPERRNVGSRKPLDLVYVANHTRMRMVPAGQRESYSSAAAGAICQNVYLYGRNRPGGGYSRADRSRRPLV
jgi:hypothetical protein